MQNLLLVLKTHLLESVFLTTSRPVSVTPNTAPNIASSTSVHMFTPPSLQSQSSHASSMSTTAPGVSYVPQSQSVPYSSSEPRSFNRNRSFDNNGRRNGSNYSGNYTQVGCQICGKTNHTAYYCYHRQNLNLPPPVQYTSGTGSSQRFRDQWRSSQGYNSQGRGQQGYFPQGYQANLVSGPQPSFTPCYPEFVSGSASDFTGVPQFSAAAQFIPQHPSAQGSFLPQNSLASVSVMPQNSSATSGFVPQNLDKPGYSGSILGTPPHQIGFSPTGLSDWISPFIKHSHGFLIVGPLLM